MARARGIRYSEVSERSSAIMSTVHQAPNGPVLVSFSSTNSLIDGLAAFIIKAQKDSLDKKGRFSIALSGGSLPKMLAGLIDNPAVRWDKWYVPIHSPEILLIESQASLLC